MNVRGAVSRQGEYRIRSAYTREYIDARLLHSGDQSKNCGRDELSWQRERTYRPFDRAETRSDRPYF